MKNTKILLLFFICLSITINAMVPAGEQIAQEIQNSKIAPGQLNSAQTKLVKMLLEKKRNELSLSQKANESLEEIGLAELNKEGLANTLDFYTVHYPKLEANFHILKKGFPIYEPAGGLTYTMSLNEMTNSIKTRFKKMYQEGRILTNKEFEKQNQDKWWLTKGEGNLTRIWGAEYLSKEFEKAGTKAMKVPKYIIVVDNLDNIKVKIDFAPCYPVVAKIIKGKIYSETIYGKPSRMRGVGYGFTDYGSPGGGENILETANFSYYVIDTESSSFYQGAPQNDPSSPFSKLTTQCDYLKDRFELINGVDTNGKIIEFSITSE